MCIHEEKSSFIFHFSIIYWITHANRMSKDFLSTFHACPLGSSLVLFMQQYRLFTCVSWHIFADGAFFIVETPTTNILHAQRLVLHTLFVSGTLVMCLTLDSPFIEIELQHPISSIDASFCPRDDGLTKVSLWNFGKFSKSLCFWVFSLFFYSRCMPTSMSTKIIALVRKGGDACDLCQWHPSLFLLQLM